MTKPTQNRSHSNLSSLHPVSGTRAVLNERVIRLLGWIATVTSVVMYVSYISQIQLNLAGHKGAVIQPLAAMLNCSLWLIYGLFKPRRDWPIVLANIPGVLLGAITFVTAL